MPEQLSLPRSDEAFVEQTKLTTYVLDPDHPTGRHKSRVFRSALAIGVEDWEYLRAQLLHGARTRPVTAVRSGPFGLVYEIVVPVDGLNGVRASVTTAWEVRGDEPPRLVTAYVDAP